MTAVSLLNEAKKRFAAGHPEESIDLFSKAAEEGCNPVTVYLNRGAALMAMKEYKEAEADFDRVLQSDADNERAHYYRGIAHMATGAYEEAITDLNASITRNHNRGVAFLARGIAYAETGQEEEAMADFKNATVLSNIEVEGFMNSFGTNRSQFHRTMALLEGERGPWKIVMNETEVEKLKKWLD
jgi:tetratricopeptide (TPR) repeat protein